MKAAQCPLCDGTGNAGSYETSDISCWFCDGVGEIESFEEYAVALDIIKASREIFEESKVCDYCSGEGKNMCKFCSGVGSFDDNCVNCGGDGYSFTPGLGRSRCGICGGTGIITESCSQCLGSGSIDCRACGGSGTKSP